MIAHCFFKADQGFARFSPFTMGFKLHVYGSTQQRKHTHNEKQKQSQDTDSYR